MKRRTLLQTAAATLAAPLAAPRISQAANARMLRFVPQADVSVLDPIWTTTYPTRDHGYLVFDTLYGQQGPAHGFAASPQMLEGHTVSSDGKEWRLTLRPGLKFHDNEPVLARDCAASIRRWGARDSFGQALMAATDALTAPDDRTILFQLKHPFPLLPQALGKSPPNMCAMMPERLAQTSPFTQVTEMIGSGPYKFNAAERVSGSRLVYDRFSGYVPRPSGTPEWTAGPKIANFDRIEWHIISDPSTALSALATGEVDWWWIPDALLLPALRRTPDVSVRIVDPTGFIGTMRFNWLNPPFDNPAIRRAIIGAVSQAEYMTAVVGRDPHLWRDGVGFFCPDTPMASDAGMSALTSPRDFSQVKKNLEAAGYRGEKVVLLAPQNIPTVKAVADVCNDMLKKIGMNVDYASMDWGTLVARRTSMAPIDQGGWSIFSTFWGGLDIYNPAINPFLRCNGKNAAPGWPTDATMESLRDDWLAAPDLAAQKKIATTMQLRAFDIVPYIPLGQQFNPTAHRTDITGILDGIPVFWNVRRV
jgi:peptide/nickel transport system substrate-binding protein